MSLTNQAAATPAGTRAEEELLWEFWYPVLRSSEIRGRSLAKTTRLEIPLIVGRDAAGRPFALRDVCPHRAYPLSLGHFDGRNVECGYHGWQFDAQTGQCKAIPSLTEDSKLKCDRIFAGSFPCEERDGYIWAYLGEPEGHPVERAALPPVPELPKFSPRYRMAHLWADLQCSMDHGIIGLMDPAHGPFVHQAWWWRSRRSIREKHKRFEPIPNGFRMSAHAPSSNSLPYKALRFYGKEFTTQIDFVLPNVRTEVVRCGGYWFCDRTTVTPVHRDLCRLDFCAAWNLFPRMPLVTPMLRFFGKRFIAQDQQVIERQQPGLQVQPRMMLIDDADRQARWYFELKEALLRSRRTGEPMIHPLDGPVTLRWRS